MGGLWELSRLFAGSYKSRRSATLQIRGARCDRVDCVDVGGIVRGCIQVAQERDPPDSRGQLRQG
jgi:hypothetical protein